MKLTKTQWKLLSYLYHSRRESIRSIAKATDLTPTQVEYNRRKLIEQGVIKRFLAMFDYSAFGYSCYAFMLVKLEKFSTFPSFTKKLENSNNCISWGECYGKYDLFSNLIFKNEQELNNFMHKLFDDNDCSISNHLLIRPYLAEFHPLKFVETSKNLLYPFVSEKRTNKPLNKDELAIAKMLQQDPNIKVIQIAKNLGISGELAFYKLKQLEKNGIFQGIRCHLDMSKAGYNYSGFFIHVKNMSSKIERKITNFARNHKLINALVLSLMNPNCFMQIIHETEDELKKVIKEVKNLLKDESFELDILLIKEEDEVNTLPFLK